MTEPMRCAICGEPIVNLTQFGEVDEVWGHVDDNLNLDHAARYDGKVCGDGR